MKIVLIRPRPHKDTIGLQSVMICEPLELMTLKSVLEKNGHDVIILDMIIENRSLEYFIENLHPDLVGITGYISHVGIIKNYASTIKRFGRRIKVVVGGVHAEVCPEDFVSEDIDLIAKTPADFYKFAGCDNILPEFPNRELPERYRKKYYYMFHRNCALIKTSVGCPYNCNFCFCKEIAPYKARKIDDVIAEIETIPQKEVYIVDDDFLFNKDRLMEFADKLQEKNIDKKYLVYGRADFIAGNEDVIKRLSEVGLRAVIVGLEAASQSELDEYGKKTKLSDNADAVKILQKYGIECYATIILKVEWEKKDFDNLYNFLKELDIVFVNLQPFTPMPHTPYFDEYKDELLITYSEIHKWDMAHLVVKPRNISVRKFYTETMKLYYKLMVNPSKAVYMIRKYGLRDTMKLSGGSARIAWQYFLKILQG